MVTFRWSHLLSVFFCCTACRADISCLNEAGKPVDWFVIYKLPRYKIGPVGSGVDYMYLDSSVGSWQTSQFMVNTSQGALGSTLNQLYLGKAYKSNSSVYALYNDAPPDLAYAEEYGHTKVCDVQEVELRRLNLRMLDFFSSGVLLSDRSQGFWLSHSVPHFPFFPERGYLYPSSGKANGQTAFCVTYKYEQFSLIVQQMAYLYPRVYNCSVPAPFRADLPLLVQLCEGSKPSLASERSTEHLLSAQGEKIFSFVKSERFVDDIYAGWVAQVLSTDLLVETWQRTAHELPSNCSLPKHAMNVKMVRLPGRVLFYSHYDHSKWCVSWAYEDQWTCLGDMNRERAQAWRGGGLLCSRNPLIYKAFRQAVDWYVGCHIKD